MDPNEWCLFPKDFVGKSYSQIDESVRSIFPSITKGDNDSVVFVLQNPSGMIALHPSSVFLYIGEDCCGVSNDPTALNVLSVFLFVPCDE